MVEQEHPVDRWKRCLASTLRPMAAPYGYTLVIWSTGMVTAGRWGPLSALDVGAYVGGALLSTFVLTLFAWGALEALPIVPVLRSPMGSAVHWLSVPVAFACAWGITRLDVPSALGAFLAAFFASLAYQALVSLERYLLGGGQC